MLYMYPALKSIVSRLNDTAYGNWVLPGWLKHSTKPINNLYSSCYHEFSTISSNISAWIPLKWKYTMNYLYTLYENYKKYTIINKESLRWKTRHLHQTLIDWRFLTNLLWIVPNYAVIGMHNCLTPYCSWLLTRRQCRSSILALSY